MTTAKKLTQVLTDRCLWIPGMLRTNGKDFTRCIGYGEVYCDASIEMVDALAWDRDSDTYWWCTVPDETWLIALADAATHGALWSLLCEAFPGDEHRRALANTPTGVTWERPFMVIESGDVLSWITIEARCIGEALLTVWGEI